MKVSIEEVGIDKEEEIIIRCHEMNTDVLELLQKIKSSQESLIGMHADNIHKLQLEDVFYFETVDNKSFLYCQDSVFETKLKLYEFEEKCKGSHFFRASKSVVLNSSRIDHIKSSISGRFEAILENDERVIVSRQFVPELKRQLGM